MCIGCHEFNKKAPDKSFIENCSENYTFWYLISAFNEETGIPWNCVARTIDKKKWGELSEINVPSRSNEEMYSKILMKSVSFEVLKNNLKECKENRVLHSDIQKCTVLNDSYNCSGIYFDNCSAFVHFAVFSGSKQFLDNMLSAGADINEEVYLFGTPLMASILIKNEDLFDYMLKKGASLKNNYLFGRNLLHFAAMSGSLEMFNKIRKLTSIKENEIDDLGRNILHYSVMSRNKRLVDYILKQNKNLNYQDKYGRTPLFYAVLHNCPEIVKSLLENGADPNTKSFEVSEIKLGKMMFFHTRYLFGLTPLEYAKKYNVDKKIIEYLNMPNNTFE
ncbi:MAG TPA: ankyrin repeat domain-containing protein [bacterium]|nr:ankyrin repeat domain-containing protein [bacterium]